jgi:hypothetical protein
MGGLELDLLALNRPEAPVQRLPDLSAGRAQEPRRREELRSTSVTWGHLVVRASIAFPSATGCWLMSSRLT